MTARLTFDAGNELMTYRKIINELKGRRGDICYLNSTVRCYIMIIDNLMPS